MKPNYDKLIWEAWGSPTTLTCGNCVEYDDRCGTCAKCNCYAYDMEIDITLAHVMQKIESMVKFGISMQFSSKNHGRFILKNYDTENRYSFDWCWDSVFVKDQSGKTKETILKLASHAT